MLYTQPLHEVPKQFAIAPDVSTIHINVLMSLLLKSKKKYLKYV